MAKTLKSRRNHCQFERCRDNIQSKLLYVFIDKKDSTSTLSSMCVLDVGTLHTLLIAKQQHQVCFLTRVFLIKGHGKEGTINQPFFTPRSAVVNADCVGAGLKSSSFLKFSHGLTHTFASYSLGLPASCTSMVR
jgi:hypothetical protein